MVSEYKHIRRVEFSDTDMAGIMHFSRYLIFMEAAEHAFFRSLGFSIHSRIGEKYYGWPRIEARCNYKKPLKFEDEVEIHLIVDEIATKTIQYKFLFRKLGNEETIVAEGLFRVICVTMNADTREMQSVPIPDEIREQIEPAPQTIH